MAISIPLIGTLAGVGLLLAVCHKPPPKAAQQAQAVAQTATAQAGLTQTVAAADQKATEKTVHLLITTQQAVRNVEVAPGANTALDPGELAAFRAGVQRVRDDAAGGNAVGDGSD